jgi:hypothetical protein
VRSARAEERALPLHLLALAGALLALACPTCERALCV